MTDEKTGETTTPTEDIIERNVSEVMAENMGLHEDVADLKVAIDELKKRLGIAEALLENQAKAPKIARIQKVSNMKRNDLAEMSLADLEKIEKVYALAKVPTFRSSADLGTNADPYYDLHNMFKYGKKKE
jgi:hypothetical protein